MASSDSKGPFENFEIRLSLRQFSNSEFIVNVHPTANTLRDEAEQQRFIESAIREKLERERQP